MGLSLEVRSWSGYGDGQSSKEERPDDDADASTTAFLIVASIADAVKTKSERER